MCTVHTSQSDLAPGIYPSDPQGHTLIVGQTVSYGETRAISICDMGNVVTIGGLEVRDPDILDQLAERLHANAAGLRHQLAHPYHPGVPGIPGCAECVGR